MESRVQVLLGNTKSSLLVWTYLNSLRWDLLTFSAFRQLKNETKHARTRLVKFHKRNLGIRKPSHPPFLEVAQEVAHMLDHIIVTYIYMERMRRDVEDEKHNL